MLWIIAWLLERKDGYRFYNTALALALVGCLEIAAYVVILLDLVFWHKIL